MSVTAVTSTMAMASTTSESSTTFNLLTSDEAEQSNNTVMGAVLGTVVGLLVLFVLTLVLSFVWYVRKANQVKQAYTIRQPIIEGGQVQVADSEIVAETPQPMDIQPTNAAVELKTTLALPLLFRSPLKRMWPTEATLVLKVVVIMNKLTMTMYNNL